jgi:hypothetical protein
MDNPGQNIWQKCHSISLPPISMLFAPIHLFFPEDLTKNSNIDIWGGTSVPKILYKVDICLYDGK